jgi:alkylation response protein AidB-like acyl-CoA dehydrogenase
MRNKDGELNNMEIIRLKDKLGTKPLPTAEILLKGARAILVSQSGKGVKSISHMLTVTRLYNASLSIGLIRRIVSLARDYANRRIVGKQILSDNQLHLSVLSDIEVIYRGNLIFYLKIAELFSKEQANSISNTEANLLRMMTPLLKLFTAKEAMSTVSEGLECFGGLGYIEGTGLPGMLRDSQLLTIWEGTTNVLCMDFVRSLYRSPFGDPIESFCFFAISSMVTVVMEELHYNK